MTPRGADVDRYFYPRPPRGGRQLSTSDMAQGRRFLSTPSARRATVNSFNVYIDGVKAIGTAPEITLPQITSETIDVSGAGILGKISAPNIGQFESIEQEVSFNLVYSSFVNVLSPKRQVNLTFRVAQQAVDKSLGYAYKGLRIVEVGRVKEFTPGKIKAGEGMEAKVKLELTYIMIENDGEEIIAIDKLNGVYRVQGEDMLADVTALI